MWFSVCCAVRRCKFLTHIRALQHTHAASADSSLEIFNPKYRIYDTIDIDRLHIVPYSYQVKEGKIVSEKYHCISNSSNQISRIAMFMFLQDPGSDMKDSIMSVLSFIRKSFKNRCLFSHLEGLIKLSLNQ